MPKKVTISPQASGNSNLPDDSEAFGVDHEDTSSVGEMSSPGSVDTQQQSMMGQEGLQSEIGATYVGHVSRLVEMYEKLGQKVTTANVNTGMFNSSLAKASASSGGDQVPGVHSVGNGVKASIEDRLSAVECKVSAILAFIGDLVSQQVDCLESSYSLQDKLQKDLKGIQDNFEGLDLDFCDQAATVEVLGADTAIVKKTLKRVVEVLNNLQTQVICKLQTLIGSAKEIG